MARFGIAGKGSVPIITLINVLAHMSAEYVEIMGQAREILGRTVQDTVLTEKLVLVVSGIVGS